MTSLPMAQNSAATKADVVVITHFASPYQVELFNALEASTPGRLTVVYLYATRWHRKWGLPELKHSHQIIEDDPASSRAATKLAEAARLLVFNFYNHPLTTRLLRARARLRRPWCFWGERTGYHLKGWLGRTYRRWRLGPLHRSMAPIWGMGRMAVEQYRREFGGTRCCFNLAYYSNLERFKCEERSTRVASGVTTFLYSGSLISRKGVDILAEAFARLASRRADVRLRWLGEGQLESKIALRLEPVRSRVEFLGFRDWSELPLFYRDADVLCVPSRHDGWGMVVPEGLAAGLPVISTPQTGAAVELLHPRRNGWLVPSGDVDALEAVMDDAASLPSTEWLRSSRAARESAASRDVSVGVEEFWAAVAGTLRHWDSPVKAEN